MRPIAIAALGVVAALAACDIFGPESAPLRITRPKDGDVISSPMYTVRIQADLEDVWNIDLVIDAFQMRDILAYSVGDSTAKYTWPVATFWADGGSHELMAIAYSMHDEEVARSDPVTVTVDPAMEPWPLLMTPSPGDSMVYAGTQEVTLSWRFASLSDDPYDQLRPDMETELAPGPGFAGASTAATDWHHPYRSLGVPDPGPYYWRVRARLPTSGAESPWSETWRFDVLDVDLSDVLEGTGVPGAAPYDPGPGLHPILATESFNEGIPVAWLARSINELELVFDVEFYDAHVQTCSYTGNHQIIRVRRTARGQLLRAVAGDSVATRMWQGTMPSGCPGSYSFGTSSTVFFSGSSVSTDAIRGWLAGYVTP